MIMRFISNQPENLETATRGGGKTENGCIAACIIACGESYIDPITLQEMGTPIMWLAGNTGQLEQAATNMNSIAPCFGGKISRSNIAHHFQIVFYNNSKIAFNPLTMTSGPREYTIIKDEGGKVVGNKEKQAYKDADGMNEGWWPFPKRIRHLTTLSYDSAIEPVWNYLEPKGLVHSLPETDAFWVHDHLVAKYGLDYEAQLEFIYGRPFVNTEYKCLMDAIGIKLFYGVQECEMPAIDKMDSIVIGIDFNEGWGHAAEAGINQAGTGKVIVFDEYRGLALRQPCMPDDPKITDPSGLSLSEWLIKFSKAYPGRVAIIGESQGAGSTYIKNLQALGVQGLIGESWSGPLQRARIPLTVDLVARGEILFAKGKVPKIRGQLPRYHLDEKGDVPRQEDHHIDALHHLVAGRSTGKVCFTSISTSSRGY